MICSKAYAAELSILNSNTKKLILFPETINGEPRTLNRINKIFGFLIKGVCTTLFINIPGKENAAFRNKPAPKSYFALVMMDVAPGSREKSYKEKISLLKSKGYRNLSLEEAATSIAIMNLNSQETKDYFFGTPKEFEKIEGGCWPTYTATTGKYNNWRLAIGDATPWGFQFHSNSSVAFSHIGVAGAAKDL